MELQGAKILHDTGCRIGVHVWSWAGYQHFVTEPPDKEQRCNCGLYTWRERHTEPPLVSGDNYR